MARKEPTHACPIGGTLQVFSGRWKPEIIWQLRQGPIRFNQLLREIDGVSQKMLTQQLRELERDGLVQRTQFEEIPPRVEYNATELTRSLEPIFTLLIEWHNENGRTVEGARRKYQRSGR